jgi:hypothetical protein
VGVLQVGGQLDLGQEALGPDHGGQLGPEHLERHPPVVPQVLGQVDGGHAAGADLPVEAIAVRQGRPARSRTYTSSRPDWSDTNEIHRPSGDPPTNAR